jgi:hypothetical protein
MIRFVPYLLRSAWRNPVRSVLTVLGVAVAVFIIAGLSALVESRHRARKAASQSLLVSAQQDQW